MTKRDLTNIEIAARDCAAASLEIHRIAEELAAAAQTGSADTEIDGLFQQHNSAVAASRQAQERLVERYQQAGIDAAGNLPD